MFDAVTGTGIFSGAAAKHIDKPLRRHGMTIVDRKSFRIGGARTGVLNLSVE